MAWRLAYSLETLRTQINAAYPSRSKVSDGTIGDEAHQAVASDHNPNAQGVVTAFDITHDPDHMDAHELAEALREKPHPDCKYIISDSRIAGPFTDWLWGYYDGIDPHDTHIHVSVGQGPDGSSTQPYDDRTNWNVKGGEVVIQDQDNWYGRMRKLHQQLIGEDITREVFARSMVGQEFQHVVEFMSDDARAAAAQNAQAVGQIAVRDDWQGQINRLTAKLTAVSGPDKIIITGKGWTALWQSIKSFFDKNN